MARKASSKRKEYSVGVDVSRKTLHVAIEGSDEVLVFENSTSGHIKLVKRLTKRGRRVRVVVESTGAYHLDFCLRLDAAARARVMVANPRATKAFHDARGVRAKTDNVDALSLRDFARIMDFEEWVRPSDELLKLRAIVRFYQQATKQQTRLKNQLHAAEATAATPKFVLDRLRRQLADIAAVIEEALAEAKNTAEANPDVAQHIKVLMTIPGVGLKTAVVLVAELLPLDPEMTSSQITAWAGLDPKPRESGSSVRGNRAISKRGNARVRAALYMPALAAARVEGPFQALQKRVTARRGKKMKGVVAVMRKLLIVSWAMLRSGETWNAQKSTSKHAEMANAA